MAVKEKIIAHDIDGNELQEGDRVLVVDTGSMSKLWQNAVGTVMELRTVDDETIQCRVKLDGNSGVNPNWHPNQLRKITTEIVEVSRLDELAGEIKGLHQECEGAIEVAQKAEKSALLSAIECGARLLEAKAECKSAGLKWETWRDENIGIPSSTATLYQRIYSKREQLEELEITTIRQAREALKSERKMSEAKSATPVAELPESKSTSTQNTPSISSEHLETTPSISEEAPSVSPDYGDQVSDKIAESLMNLGVMPCKPSISPEEFNREMAKSGLITQDIKIINPRVKRCEFLCNGVLKNGVISGVLFDWKRMSVAAVLIDYDDGKQIQVPASNAWLIDENNSESNDQPINRFAAIEELERRGWFWDAARRIDINGDYCYWANISSPKCDIKELFFAQRFECLEDALEQCIEQAKAAGVWEDEA